MSFTQLLEHLARRGDEPTDRLTWRAVVCIAVFVGVVVGVAVAVVALGAQPGGT